MADKKQNNKPNKPTGNKRNFKKPFPPKKNTPTKPKVKHPEDSVRLNRFIANAGICSRREADTLIESGAVEVNGKVVTELGSRVMPTDKVMVGGESIKSEKKVYILMNKPKNFITTVSDPKGRKTVMQLVGKMKHRVYPVGRLDRATTGVLMFTNDGDLTKKLTHPKHGVRKIYQVALDKPMSQLDLNVLEEGFELEDGFIKADEAKHVGNDRKVVGIELHSGKNRIVRRMIAHLGYKVIKLDRVYFAGLTKKNLSRGQWRYLTDEELAFLKMIPDKK